MQLQKQTRPGVCSAPDPQWTRDKGVHIDLLQHDSWQQGQVSASRVQELVSPHNAVTQGPAPCPRGVLTASPAGQAPGPTSGSLPSRAVSALGEQHPHLPSWASNRCLWGGPQHVLMQVPWSRTCSTHGPAHWLLPFAQAHQPETTSETSGVGCCIWWQVGRELCNYLSGNYVSTQCPFLGICILPYNVLSL